MILVSRDLTKHMDSYTNEALKITLSMVGVFLSCVLIQTYIKFKAIAAFKKQKAEGTSKECYNRYTDKAIVVGDRVVGNTLEWMWLFLMLLWLNAVFVKQPGFLGFNVGWVYVVARALYPVIAVHGGIKLSGPQHVILLATVPGYVTIISLIYPLVLVAWK